MSETDDRTIEMTFDARELVKAGLEPFEVLGENARLMIPSGDLPVMAMINGKKMEVGRAHIDPETNILTTKLDSDLPASKIWLDSIKGSGAYSAGNAGLVAISEVTFQEEAGDEDLGTTDS